MTINVVQGPAKEYPQANRDAANRGNRHNRSGFRSRNWPSVGSAMRKRFFRGKFYRIDAIPLRLT